MNTKRNFWQEGRYQQYHQRMVEVILWIIDSCDPKIPISPPGRAQCERKQYSAGAVSDYKLASHLISNSVRDFFEWMGGSWCCQQLSSVSEWGEGASTLPIVASAQHRFTQNNDTWFYLPLEALVSNNSWKHHESERWSHCQAKKNTELRSATASLFP